MILVDTNILIYAYVGALPQHKDAKSWLDSQLNDSPRVGLPWQSLLGFLRIVTNRRVFEQPASVQKAWEQVENWLGNENVWIPGPGETHRTIFARLLQFAGSGANLIPDTSLAALAIEHGLTLCSSDGDFGRFAGLKWKNPLLNPIN